MAPTPDFKVMLLFNAEYLRNGTRYIVSMDTRRAVKTNLLSKNVGNRVSTSAEPFSHGTGTLLCLQNWEMATYRHWYVSLRRNQTMSHIVESCPLTKLNGGLSRLHSADEDAVSWLTSDGSWNAYEKKKKNGILIWTYTRPNQGCHFE